MSNARPVTFARDADNVGWIVFDDPEARANVFNEATLSALESALAEAERSGAAAVVIASGKDNIFIAGADLKMLAAFSDAATATMFSRRGQQVFQRIAALRVPVVCAIHGACAGGGFELALACQWRIATDAAATRIGLPETSIGTIPGWGGSVRLPRLIGVQPALEHILAGHLLPAAEVAKAGLVNEIVPAAELKPRARTVALKLAADGVPAHAPRPAAMPNLFAELRAKISARTRDRLPALLAAIDAVEQTAQLPIPEALEIEARIFGDVTAGPVCKNLIRVFFLREAAKKRTLDGWFEAARRALRPDQVVPGRSSPGIKPLPQRVAVIGAGVMGAGIAQWLAARGIGVVLRDVSPELVDRGLATVRKLFDEAVRRGKIAAGEANAALHRITTTTAWEGFADCDFVIEAIVEDAEAKRRLFSEIADIVREDAVLASNTSALPIEEIAGHVPNPARTIGIHFFNPVSRMSLVELVVGRHTSAETGERALALVKALGKSPVICRSSPGFLVTRVLFFYLNEAVRLWEQGVPTGNIDRAMLDWGWPMGPLRLIDEVGIDVTDFIFGELAHYFPERFTRTRATAQLVAAGLLGRKAGAGAGFYVHATGREEPNPRAQQIAGAAGVFEMRADRVQETLLGRMVGEGSLCLKEGVVKSPDDIDFALLSGAGFPAWRGGLMQWANANRFAGR